MPFNWHKRAAKEQPSSSRLQIKVFSTTNSDIPESAEWSKAKAGAEQPDQLRLMNENKKRVLDLVNAPMNGHCGFATMTQENDQKSNNNDVTIAVAAKALFIKLKTDEEFRERILTSSSSVERMQIIEAEGFGCSTYELRMVMEWYLNGNGIELNRVIGEKNAATGNNFSLWGKKIPE